MSGRAERTARENALWATVLVEELVRAGLRTVVVAPGSRSAPLVHAVAEHPDLRTIVQVDERSAGFLALGVGKSTGRPAAVITTSGTAVANLLPAVVEAAASEVPLLLLTADRPPRLRGNDANQAIDQTRIFGMYPRHFQELSPARAGDAELRHLRASCARAMAEAIGDPAGPVHLNVPFEKPLEPVEPEPSAGGVRARAGTTPWTRTHPRRAVLPPEGLEALAAAIDAMERPLLVAGRLPRPWESGPELAALARRTGIPLLADPLSGARFTAEGGGLGGYDLALSSTPFQETHRPDGVVRFGASPTSSRLLSFLAGLEGGPRIVVDGGGGWKDHESLATEMLHADPGLVAAGLAATLPRHRNGAWHARWSEVEGDVEKALPGALAEAPCEGTVLAAVVRSLPPGEILFISSSMPVRDLDAFGLPGLRQAGSEPLLVLGNRGASGIDGIISTALGAGVGRDAGVTAVVGDLALLHDANGLLALPDAGIRLTLVVVNNDGGGIFHLLPIREHEPGFTRFFATPHGREPARIAALHGMEHRRTTLGVSAGTGDDPTGPTRDPVAGLEGALAWAWSTGESRMLEVRTDREANRRNRAEVFRTVATAIQRS